MSDTLIVLIFFSTEFFSGWVYQEQLGRRFALQS